MSQIQFRTWLQNKKTSSLMLSKKHIRSWSFMELIVTKIVKIIKSEVSVNIFAIG